MLIHVDNVLLACNDMGWWKELIASWDFQVDRVHDKSILGLHIERTSLTSVSFSQENYISDLITEYGLENKPIVHVPLRKGIEQDFVPERMSKDIDPNIPYRRLNMKLYWSSLATARLPNR